MRLLLRLDHRALQRGEGGHRAAQLSQRQPVRPAESRFHVAAPSWLTDPLTRVLLLSQSAVRHHQDAEQKWRPSAARVHGLSQPAGDPQRSVGLRENQVGVRVTATASAATASLRPTATACQEWDEPPANHGARVSLSPPAHSTTGGISP